LIFLHGVELKEEKATNQDNQRSGGTLTSPATGISLHGEMPMVRGNDLDEECIGHLRCHGSPARLMQGFYSSNNLPFIGKGATPE